MKLSPRAESKGLLQVLGVDPLSTGNHLPGGSFICCCGGLFFHCRIEAAQVKVSLGERDLNSGLAQSTKDSQANLVHERLRGGFEFERRGVIQVKGKGAIEAWLLHGEVCTMPLAG